MNREELLSKFKDPIEVLDKGFIRLVDVMGNDSSIVQAARVSYGTGTKTPSDDRSLIRYLIRHFHTTPIEQCELKLHVRVPMDCWRQWIRHRMASVNEYSTRYSEAIDDKQETDFSEWRAQSSINKQGSEGSISWPENEDDIVIPGSKNSGAGVYLSARERDFHRSAQSLYRERLAFGVAREQARKDLPLSTYTEAYWKIDLHNLLHFLRLRMDSHAQLEIRQYANAIAEVVKEWVPYTWEAFEDYRLNSISFSAPEIKVLNKLLTATDQSYLDEILRLSGLSKREVTEFKDKLVRIGK